MLPAVAQAHKHATRGLIVSLHDLVVAFEKIVDARLDAPVGVYVIRAAQVGRDEALIVLGPLPAFGIAPAMDGGADGERTELSVEVQATTPARLSGQALPGLLV